MAPGSTVIGKITLTIVGDVDGSARSKNGVNAGVVKACGVRGAVLGLTENISTLVCQATRGVIHLGTVEQRARASGIGDGEGVVWEGTQDPTGIVEEFDGPVTSVGDSCGDPQVLQPVDMEVGGRGLDGQARGSGDGGGGRYCDHRGDESDEKSAEGRREHRGEGREGD